MTDAERTARGRWLTPLTLSLAFLLVGLATLDYYGVSWDEPLHREWGRVLWSYTVTGDEALLDGLEGGGEFYGPLFYILNYGVSSLAHEIGMPVGPANHVLTLATAAAGVLCTGLVAGLLYGRASAFGASLLLCLTPPFFAHAHYNPKDIPLLALVAATVLFAARAYRAGRVRDAVACGALLGLATGMKPTALVMVPVIGAAIGSDLLARRGAGMAATVRLAAIAAAAALVALFAGWPTLWRRPDLLLASIRYFGSGSFWDGSVLYAGRITAATELPWHYTPVMLLVAIPVVTWVLAGFGAAAVGWRAARREAVFEALLPLLWIGLPLLVFLKPGLARYDGMRQLFFVVPAVAILGGVGWRVLWRFLERARGGRRAAIAASTLIAGWLVVESARAFPYGGSYVNGAARLVLGPHIERRLEVEYWGVTYREGMRWLQRHAAPNSVVCVPVASQILPWHQVLLWQWETSRADLVYDCGQDPDYVMLMTRFAEWPAEYRVYLTREPVYAISRLGSDLLYIYAAR